MHPGAVGLGIPQYGSYALQVVTEADPLSPACSVERPKAQADAAGTMLRLTLRRSKGNRVRGLSGASAWSAAWGLMYPRRKGSLLSTEEDEMGLLRPSNTRVLRGVRGPACPRCRRATEVREHIRVTAELHRKPFYFRRWYYCTNPTCDTRVIVDNTLKVKRKPPHSAEPRR